MKDIARQSALKILNIVEGSQRPLDAVVDEHLPEGSALLKRDRAFIQTIVYGTLRWRGRIDWVIAHFSSVKIHRIDPKILNILRMGLFQIMFLDRVPVSAAVNTAVELSKSVAEPYVVKFANAVLRKAAAGHTQVPFPAFEKDPAASIAARHSFPQWLVERWLERFGPEECTRLCSFVNTIPPITVRANSLKTDRNELKEALEKDTESAVPTRSSPVGISITGPRLPIPKMSAYRKGWFQVQDEAAQLVSIFLSPEPGERIMDACAGLGGKTGHIAQLMHNRGKIIAADKDRCKLSQLRTEMMHLGISMVTTRMLDLERPPAEAGPAQGFDRILLDAPCSGLGVLRRNPDAKWVSAKRNLTAFKERQVSFLTQAAQLLKTGGTLLYTVCSMEPEENEAVVSAFLEKHTDYAVDADRQSFPDAVKPFVDRQGFFRTFPHAHNMDGFFAARLKRIR
ncbi:MAG: 16S rRNA (cytosine(967)-C(5))-methyltransferase RsmB [Deltaproteobacteria bacterium]|nr:16S rRNA (cytosine(967)-C(5))-methyltransferase RsmB [Deltaproteobacteria bacterium]